MTGETHRAGSLPISVEEVQAQAMRGRYLDAYARLTITNRILRVSLMALAIVCVGLTVLSVRALQAVQNVRPVIVRVDDIGRAEAVRQDVTVYTPREPEVRYFLTEFVTMHFGRLRSTVRRDFAASLLFLERTLSYAIVQAERETRAIETFLGNGEAEIEIEVANVTLDEIRTAPYRARVDFERVFLQPHTRQELRRQRYVGTFHFVVADTVSNDLIPVNPLGLTITYFREDQAF